MTGGSTSSFALSQSTTLSEPAILGGAGMFAASAEAMMQWALVARERERCVFLRASTVRSPVAAAAVKAAEGLVASGLAMMAGARRHEAGSDLFDHLLRRTAQPVCCDLRAPEAARPVDEDRLKPNERLLLELLSRTADAGAPCPDNRTLARNIGLRTAGQVKSVIVSLRKRGAILLAGVPERPGRVVTIVETGARTGLFGRDWRVRA